MDTVDAKALAPLWVKAQPTLASFIQVMVPNSQQAEEVLQETALDCVGKFHTFDRSRSFDAWAIGVARNRVLQWRRKHAREKHVFDDDLVSRIATSYQRQSSRAAVMRIALQQCVQQATARSRQVLEMFYGGGKKTDGIAAEMQMTGAAVRKLLARTRTSLRQCIERRMASGGD